MALLQNAVSALAAQAGWRQPVQADDGAYHFRLAGELDFAVFSPDGRQCVIRATLMSVPDTGAERDELLALVAQRQVGACRTRASTVALEKAGDNLLRESMQGERLILYRLTDMSSGQEVLNLSVKDFLNDLAWWKAACGSPAQVVHEQPVFSMPGMFVGSRY